MSFQIDIDTGRARAQFASSFGQLQNRAGNLSPLMSEIGEYYYTKLQKNYDSQVDPYDSPWAALRPGTLRQKRGDSRILQNKGNMRGTLAQIPSGDSVEIGYNATYAKYHQFGTSKMVQRKVVPDAGLPPGDEPKIMNMIEAYLAIF